MLFHLLPTETLSRADTAEQITEPYCRSILTEENGEAAARAIVCMDGAVHEAEKRASVTGLATLDYKRTIEQGENDCVRRGRAVSAAGSGLGQPDRRASGQAGTRHDRARHDARRGGGRAARALSRFARAHGADDSCSRNRAMEMDKTIGENDISLYVGIPFCPSRCYYCSFVSATTAQSGKLSEAVSGHALPRDRQPRPPRSGQAGAERLHRRWRHTDHAGRASAGTDAVGARKITFDFSHLREYTVEAGRPIPSLPEKLRACSKSAGVGRVSINPQSMNDAVLAAIGRKHGSADVLRAFDEARRRLSG